MTAAELRARLNELGWTQRHLAKMLGITPRTVNRWATGALEVPVYCAAYLEPAWYTKQAWYVRQQKKRKAAQ